jgi:hypothetical protein
MFLLLADFRYFMRELLPLGAMEKAQLPVYLTSWIDKTSPLCMYTMTHTHIWSNAHLKAGCWYTDCGKAYCPLEEEDVKKACIQADSKGAALNTKKDEEQEDEVEVDINQLPKKERNKIINQRKKDAKKAKDKAEKDAEKAKEKEKKEAKKGEKSGKSKHSTPPDRDFLCIAITEPPQAGCLHCIGLTIKTAVDHIIDPNGLYRGGFACSRVLFLWIPSVH